MSETREQHQTNGLFTTEEVAASAGISTRSVLYHIRVGHLPAEKKQRKLPGQRGGYYRWLVRPADVARFKGRLERGEIGVRGGNYGGGRPAGETLKREEDYTHIYIPCSAGHRQWLADMLSPDERLAILDQAARLKLANKEKFQRMLEK